MIKKIFTFVFLTLFLMLISIFPVKANDLFKVAITGVTNNSDGAISNYSSYTDNSVTFITELYLPGDNITYEIKVKNFGSIDAILSKINTEETNNPAIIFEYQGINEGDILKAGEEKTFMVKVTYNNEVTTQPTNLTSEIKIILDYEQHSDSGSNEDPETGGATDGTGIGAGGGDTVDILGVSVPNTVAYTSLYIIIIGLLLIIIAIIVLKRTVDDQNQLATDTLSTVSDESLKNKSFEIKYDDDIEILDLEPIQKEANPNNSILNFEQAKANNDSVEVLDLGTDEKESNEKTEKNTNKN